MKTNSVALYPLALIISVLLATSPPAVAQTVADLGEGQNFTILGGSAVTNTGITVINGNLGVSPGSSITGFPPGTVINGAIYNNVAPATTAHADTITAYNLLAGVATTANLTTLNLGGMTLAPGVYKFDSTAGLTGTLTLNNVGNQNGTYVFQVGSGLTTAPSSAVVLLGGSDPNIFWQIGSSATLGTATVFEGNIVANTSITLDPGASIAVGRALAINGAVTMAGGNSANLNALALPLVSVGAYWNGTASANWSEANWSPTVIGGASTTLTPLADVVFSVNAIPAVQPLNENTILDYNANISSLTVNDPLPVTISSPILGPVSTLTITGAAGAGSTVTISSGAGLTTINSDLVLGGLSQGINVSNSAGLVINGAVNGAMGLTKTGSGVLTLNGANTYTGGTNINAGSLAVGSAGALGAGSVTNSATLETTAALSAVAPRAIHVNGSFVQNGTGTLLLQVANSPLPTPSMNTGIAGTDYDTLVVTGTALPGGALDLNFKAGTVPSQGQRYVAVTAGAPVMSQFISPTTTNLPASFYTVTTYNDTFGGSQPADSVIVTLLKPFALSPGLTPNQTSVGNNIDNNIALLGNNGSMGTPTGAAADFFNNIVTGLNISSNTNGALGQALNELSPQRFQILRNIAFDNYAFEVQSLDNELARERNGPGGFDMSGFVFNDRTLGAQLSSIKSRLYAWNPPPSDPGLLSDSNQTMLAGATMSQDKDLGAIGYHAQAPIREPLNKWNGFIDGGAELGDLDHNVDVSHSSYTTGRARIGVDYRVATNLRVGALFGFSHTDADLDYEGSKAKVDSYTPGLYLAYADKLGFYANGLFTYTRNEYSTDRRIVIPGVDRTANGSTDGDQFGANLSGGYEFHRNNWTFGPAVGLTYVNLGINSFNETGAGAANLNVGNQSDDSLRSRLGATVRYQEKIGSVVIVPHLSAFWQHEFLDGSKLITSQFEGLPAGTFSIQTIKGDSDNALLGAGIDVEVTDRVTLFVDYQTEAGGSSFFGQSATGGVKVSF